EAGWHSRISRESVDLIELVDDEDGVSEDEEGTKYVYKGHDKQAVNVDKDGEQVVNEIKRFQDTRYVSPHEAMCDQKNAYDAIMRHVDDNSTGVFFLDGPGRTGKTFLYKALLATVRSRGLIALAIASSGAAENNMTGGRTAQSSFKIPINLTTNSICNIKKQSGLAKLLCQAKLIIWDEALMAKR
nr:hypothetical protein [Tanacetum cinerariifolium]